MGWYAKIRGFLLENVNNEGVQAGRSRPIQSLRSRLDLRPYKSVRVYYRRIQHLRHDIIFTIYTWINGSGSIGRNVILYSNCGCRFTDPQPRRVSYPRLHLWRRGRTGRCHTRRPMDAGRGRAQNTQLTGSTRRVGCGESYGRGHTSSLQRENTHPRTRIAPPRALNSDEKFRSAPTSISPREATNTCGVIRQAFITLQLRPEQRWCCVVCAVVHRGALPPSTMRQRTKRSHGARSGEGEGRHGSSLYAQEEGKVRVNVVGSRREIQAEFG
jgi:hypothetical protein